MPSLSVILTFAGALVNEVTALTDCGSKAVSLDLIPLYNNKAFGRVPGEAAFDHLGQSYRDPGFADPTYTSHLTGIEYAFPGYTGPDLPDNVICDGQIIPVPQGDFFSLSFLAVNDREIATVSENVTLTYTDDSTQLYELRTLAWFNTLTINRGEIIFPGRWTADANSRCGIAQGDFDTPEYQTFASPQAHKWESNRGMDPYSYGFNRATQDREYMNASTIVYSLVDMTSKNGNFLLNVGPRSDGTIVEQAADNLREAGRWIQRHGEAVYNTTYWLPMSQIARKGDPNIRFTHSPGAHYTFFLERPRSVDGKVTIPAPVPALPGDVVSLLGVEDGESLNFEVVGEGSNKPIVISVSENLLQQEELCWVFKVEYVA
ncbi:hypothetical protein NLU13_5752 [Sarocladium strictum]|uniref:alpha-L-fucosidase n=1 Tax=Sarocladium strictum TaxID=5046 RepID=A0AA39L843_SARSR|nr:hypothetical protein NLU13_5752 [Sarocladium strictum]